jgi:16S rRNA (guanine527-N7)-methyltransferase
MALGLSLGESAQEKLIRYLQLLEKWNKAYNLTAVRKPEEMVTHHLLDSLAVYPHIVGPRILDVGSGAGLPGIPLAIAQPDWHIEMLDSNNKKTRFITQAISELGVENASVVHARAEEYHPEKPYDTVISRAYSSAEKMIQTAGQHCAKEGCLLLMKGAYPVAELEQVPETFRVTEVFALQVPGLDAERHLVKIVRQL